MGEGRVNMAASNKCCIRKPVGPQAVALGKDVSVAIMLKSGGSTSPVGMVMDGGVGKGLFYNVIFVVPVRTCFFTSFWSND